MREVYVRGVGQTPFGRHLDQSHKSLAEAAVVAAIKDAGDVVVDEVVFASCAAGAFGQGSVRGPVILRALMARGQLPAKPTLDVEAACASGMVAFDQACAMVASGQCESALAVGVDKTFIPDMSQLGALFAGAFDVVDPDTALYVAAAEALGTTFAPHPARLLTMDVCALLCLHAMKHDGVTVDDLAAVAAKAHGKSIAEVLADKPILAPFTRSMCTGLADGAAAVVVSAVAGPGAVKVTARRKTLGGRLSLEVPSVLQRTAEALGDDVAGVDVAEVHDATAFGVIAGRKAFKLGRHDDSSANLVDVNPSGGLLKKGHPLAATGLSMVGSVVGALRQGRRKGLVYNAGGFIGLDEAVAVAAVFEA